MKTLVAGIGNIFMGDDGFGCEVAQRLSRCAVAEGVDVVDFGIRGVALGYALMDDYAAAILIDTVDRGAAPGTVFVIEPELENVPQDQRDALLAPHGMDPARVLEFVATLGKRRPRIVLVGCQPEYLGGDEGHMGLSETVTAAVEQAVKEVQALLVELSIDDCATDLEKQAVSA